MQFACSPQSCVGSHQVLRSEEFISIASSEAENEAEILSFMYLIFATIMIPLESDVTVL